MAPSGLKVKPAIAAGEDLRFPSVEGTCPQSPLDLRRTSAAIHAEPFAPRSQESLTSTARLDLCSLLWV